MLIHSSSANHGNKAIICFAICATFLAVLSGCGGTSGSSGAAAPATTGNSAAVVPTLSADQKIYEDAELNGGSYTLDWYIPYGGGNLVSGTNYLYSTTTGGLTKSPLTAGPQLETPRVTSLESALSVPAIGDARFLANGKILLRSSTAMRRVTYSGSGVQIDYLADDGATAVESALFNQFVEVPLTGIIDNSPAEFQSSIPVDEWVTANNFSANAKWLPGSFYTTRKGQLIADTYIVGDCPLGSSTKFTQGTTPTPCAGNATLGQIFPMVLYDSGNHVFEVNFATDGQFSTIQGLPMWISNQAMPLGESDTTSNRIYFELNGNVYTGVLRRNGTSFNYERADGSEVKTSLQLNANAVTSIQQGFISGATVAGSQAGIASPIGTIDLFGIGGHAINGALAPQDLITHYNIPSGLTGAGQIIAIVDGPGSGDFVDDLNLFSATYGLPSCGSTCLQRIDLSNGAPITGDDWGFEIALDTQLVHAIAPGAQIVLVTAVSDAPTDLIAAINRAAQIPGVTVVSMSLGIYPTPATSVFIAQDALFQSYLQQGIIFFASSGDNGYLSDGPSYPASSPYVTAVGGTRINSVAWNPTQNTDTAWSFSGGGPSAYAAMPSWQSNFVGTILSSENTYMRAVPDVAAVGDYQHSAVAIYHRQSWVMSGGTSASAPIWAGIAALVGQQWQNQSKSLSTTIANTPGGFNALLYQSTLFQGSSPALRYVTTGSNNLYGSACSFCNAGAAYSDVTGLGTPNVTQFLTAF